MNNPKERPILFSAEMIRAILEGRKTMTRCVVKQDKLLERQLATGIITSGVDYSKLLRFCPYGQPGDRLWVRETWAFAKRVEPDYDVVFCDWRGLDWYPKDGSIEPGFAIKYEETPYLNFEGKWRPAIYMPRWASRITLEIVSIKIETLQDISEVDTQKEGVSFPGSKEMFAKLWDSINAKRGFGWETNPFCWAIEFKKVEG